MWALLQGLKKVTPRGLLQPLEAYHKTPKSGLGRALPGSLVANLDPIFIVRSELTQGEAPQ